MVERSERGDINISTRNIYKKMEKGKTLRYNRWRVPPGVIQLKVYGTHYILRSIGAVCVCLLYIYWAGSNIYSGIEIYYKSIFYID